MRKHTILLGLLASLTATGCKELECAEGTIERDGACEPAESGPISEAKCGDNTELVGDQCVPVFPPTRCESGSTIEEPDENGVIVCKGVGGNNCDVSIPCPTPTGASKQTICGQLYDFETGAKFQTITPPATEPKPNPCNPMSPAASGPCAVTIAAYDALAFGNNPTTATPLPVGSLTIDECGRYRVENIETNGTGPFIGLGVDDATGFGAGGVTVTAAVATPKLAMSASKDLEAFIVKQSTTSAWTAAGGPPLSGGIYAPIFRAHKLPSALPFAPQAGVTVTRNSNTIPTNDYYFSDTGEQSRMTIGSTLTATGANGTALITNASVSEQLAYGGSGGLGAGCRWEPHAGASLPQFGGIVFIQVFRKIDILGMTCND